MKVVYTGPHGSVVVALPTGREVECEHGAPVEVPDSLGESLLKQPGNWKRAAEPKPAPTPKDDTPAATGGKE